MPDQPWYWEGSLTPECDGNTVVFCNAGRIERIDCTTFGFTGCGAGACTPNFKDIVN